MLAIDGFTVFDTAAARHMRLELVCHAGAVKLRLELRQAELRKCMEKLHGPKAVRLLFQRDSAQRGVWNGDVISATTVTRACINVAKMI